MIKFIISAPCSKANLLNMSASSTVTKPSKRNTLAKGKPSTDDIPLPPDSERDPLEIKHRDFFWTYTEEPHRSRRLAIIKAHPEVNTLFALFQFRLD